MYTCNDPNCYQGIVFRKDLGLYRVQSETDMISCILSSKINKKLVFSADNPNARRRKVRDIIQLKMTDPVVVGDAVRFLYSGKGTGMITEILPRRNQLVRRDPAPGNHPFEQVIASNLDYMIPVFAVRYPEPKWGMLDRYLVAAESLDLRTLIVITKNDLQGEGGRKMREMLNNSLDIYRFTGYNFFKLWR